MKTPKQYEVIYKHKNDTIEHSWKCWATSKESAKSEFRFRFDNSSVVRINKI